VGLVKENFRMGVMRMQSATYLVGVVLAGMCGHALAQDRTSQVYVVNPTGDISAKTAEAMAEWMSAELIRAGIQAFTYGNLADQLKEEERKEILKCDEGSRCVDELVSSFGFARRLFGKVTKQGAGEWTVVLTLMDKSKVKNKVPQTVKCSESDLPGVAATMARSVMGLKGGGGGGDGGGIVDGGGGGTVAPEAPATEYVVTFDSEPRGAMVELDGVPQKGTRCDLYVGEGAHEVRMALPRHEPKKEMVVVRGKQTVSWKLSPTFGWLNVNSEPSGLKVRIGREGRGESQVVTTPVAKLELDPGRYRVEVEETAYAAEWKVVSVEKGKEESVALAPKQRVGYLKVKAFDSKSNALAATVRAGGRVLGEVPGPWLLMVGSYELEVGLAGYDSAKERVEIVEGKTVERVVKLEGGTSPAGGGGGVSKGKAGMEWVSLKGGTFQMGSKQGFPDERPVHPVTLGDFEIARTEVTVKQYQACVDEGACTEPRAPVMCGRSANWGVTGREDHPINCVVWDQAKEYSEWVGGRLCTEAEWEYAARSGGQDREYPWGNQKATCKRAVMWEGELGCGEGTWPVCSRTEGNTEQGVCDMAGNVWEWVADWKGDYSDSAQTSPTGPEAGYFRVFRGGGWNSKAEYVRAARRDSFGPGQKKLTGFRPCRSR